MAPRPVACQHHHHHRRHRQRRRWTTTNNNDSDGRKQFFRLSLLASCSRAQARLLFPHPLARRLGKAKRGRRRRRRGARDLVAGRTRDSRLGGVRLRMHAAQRERFGGGNGWQRGGRKGGRIADRDPEKKPECGKDIGGHRRDGLPAGYARGRKDRPLSPCNSSSIHRKALR